jgi:uncharacterized protein
VSQRPILTADWRYLVMLTYEIDPLTLAPWVPAGTALDSWQNRTFISLVGFRFLDTRLLGIPVPFHRNFEELNLRFYVRRQVGIEVRRGVVFLREFVSRRAIAAVARSIYNEPYQTVPMRSRIDWTAVPEVEYAWRVHGRWHTLTARATGSAAVPVPESLEAFITEHYWGYTRQRNGGTVEYRVAHPQWRVWHATDVRLDADLRTVCGAEVAHRLVGPTSILIADGSPVSVYRPYRLPDCAVTLAAAQHARTAGGAVASQSNCSHD